MKTPDDPPWGHMGVQSNTPGKREHYDIDYAETEADMFKTLTAIVQRFGICECESFITFNRYDPELVVGYEIERASLGYLVDRAKVIGIDLPQQLSRVKPNPNKQAKPVKEQRDEDEEDHGEIRLQGLAHADWSGNADVMLIRVDIYIYISFWLIIWLNRPHCDQLMARTPARACLD